MGTRSIVKFIEIEDEIEYPLCAVYQQFDGYLSGVGQELVDFLKSRKLVNGIGPDDEKVFNGIGCLAAQFIREFKTRHGGLYMTPLDSIEQYNYDVLVKDMKILIRYEDTIYTVDEFQEIINKGEK